MSARWERAGGLCGIGFVAVSIAAIVVAGSPPKPDSATAKIVAYVVDHRSRVLASCFLFTVASVLLLVFIATVVIRLRNEPLTPAPVVALIGGLLMIGIATIATLAQMTLAYRVGAEGGPTAQTLFDLGNLANATIGFGAALFLGGIAAGLAGTTLPRWLLPATVVVGAAELASTFQIFPRKGAFAPGGGLTYGFFALFMLWTVAFSIAMLTEQRRAAPVSSPLPTGRVQPVA